MKLRSPDELSSLVETINKEVDDTIRSAGLAGRFIKSFRKVGLSELSVRQFVSDKTSSMMTYLDQENFIEIIPRFYHRIWITGPLDGHLPPDEYLEDITSESLIHELGFKRFFWTNSEAVQTLLLKFFSDRNANIEVRLIATLSAEPGLHNALQKLVLAKKYVFAADIAKVIVLSVFGGIYSDMGMIVDPQLADLVLKSDLALLITGQLFFQLSFLAAPAKSDLISLWTRVIVNPEVLSTLIHPDVIEITAVQEVELLAGPGFTIFVLLFAINLDRIVFVPPQGRFMKWRSQRSWYPNSQKFGNIAVEKSAVTLVTKACHQDLLSIISDDGIRSNNLTTDRTARNYVISSLRDKFNYKPPGVFSVMLEN